MKEEMQFKMSEYLKIKLENNQNPENKEMPRYVFVIFKTMVGMGKTQEKYSLSNFDQFVLNHGPKMCCFKKFFKEKREEAIAKH